MQLSVVIPEYNYDCTQLVSDLRQSCEAAYGLSSYEILVIDDGSSDTATTKTNSVIDQWPNCRFIRKPGNTGRAATRNEGILQSSGNLVVIIDCDAEVCSPDFISRYLEAARQETGSEYVICGNIVTSPQYGRPDNQLRYRYELAAGCRRTLTHRNAHPYDSFTAFNVMISRSVFGKIKFNESFSQYGYEDALLGMQLKQTGIPVRHIDNPLVHTGIESNDIFLRKTEQALQNLYTHAALFPEGTPITRTAARLRHMRLLPLLRRCHKWLGPLERRNLLGCRPSLFLFKLYKIGYYAGLHK